MGGEGPVCTFSMDAKMSELGGGRITCNVIGVSLCRKQSRMNSVRELRLKRQLGESAAPYSHKVQCCC